MKAQVLIPKVATAGLRAPRGERIPFSQLTATSRKAIAEKRTAVLDYERPDTPPYDGDIALANEARMVLFVPLIHKSDVIGHISLDEPGQRHEFSAKQVRVVESIAAQATVALQNARQFEREHRISETLQQALLGPPAHIDGISMSCLYQAASAAARVGGDFYDAFTLDDERVAVVVGDVAGKGMGAAPLTALLRDGVRAYLLEDSDPAACFTRLNNLTYRFTPSDKFATVFIGVLNRFTRELLYCSAAHPHAVVQGDGETRVLGCVPAPLIGAFADADYETQRTVLAPGEVLVIVTDGVTEARHGNDLFGEEGLRSAVGQLSGKPVEELPRALLDAVLEFARGQLRDDVVVLCVSMTP
jgi:serine phosphatase RsbU (regulator of sigma subunit)